MAKVMMERSLTLVLRADKTFDLNMIFTLSGTWKVTQDKLILTGVDSKGMSNPNSKLSGPLEFKVSGTTLTPVAETKGLSFSFVKN